MSDIEFVDHLPKSKRVGAPPGVVIHTVETLKTRPGVWAKVATAPNPGAAAQRAKNYRDHGCEAHSRDADVFARWPALSENGAS